MVNIYSGNYAVFDSRSVFTFSEHDGFELEIIPSDEFKFKLFINIEENGGVREVKKTTTENNIYITCCNFGLGAGTTIPIEIATFSEKKMYINFWIESIDSYKKVHCLRYSIFIER